MFRCKDNNDMFDSLEEFMDNLERGGEVEFTYNHANYSITHASGMIIFIKIGDSDSIREFEGVNKLLEHKVDGVPMRGIVKDIKPYFRTF